MKKGAFYVVLLISLFLWLLPLGSAVTIFSDGFESGTLDGWILTSAPGADENWTASQTNPNTGSWHAQAIPRDTTEPAATMERIISTVGYQNITFSYYRKIVNFEGFDDFEVEWFNGVSWTVVEAIHAATNDANYSYKQFNLTSQANNNSNFRIKFECTGGEVDDTCRVDDISIDGSIIDVTPPAINFVAPTESNGSFITRKNVLINVTASDDGSGLKNITIRLFNSTYSQVNSSNLTTSPLFVNFTNLNDGIYYFNATAYDNNDNVNHTETRTVTIDTTLPEISIIYPLNNSNFSSNNIGINYTISDINLFNCWWTKDGGTNNISISSCGTNITGETWGEGINNVTVYANDSAGNENSSSVTFRVDTAAPIVTLIKPSAGQTFGTNASLPLEFSVSDGGVGLGTCWYAVYNSTGNINGNNNNITISCSQNTTFNVTGNGNYNIFLYANDTLNNIGSTSNSFSVSLNAPAIDLIFPNDNSYLNFINITFRYNASDSDLDTCELWGNFTGTFVLNQTNTNVVSGVISNFSLNLTESGYIWAIRCNDTQNNIAMTNNRSFFVDLTSPSVSVSEPSGVKTTQSNIPLTFSVSDVSPVSCIYNVFKGASPDVANTTINCSVGSSSFNVSGDGSYVLNFYVNDSAGNSNSASSSFSVDTSGGGGTGTGTTGGGGTGGGGSTGGGPGPGRPSFVSVPDVRMKQGETKTFSIEVTNLGVTFLNKCGLFVEGAAQSWASSDQVQSFGLREKIEYLLTISVPRDTNPGDYSSNLIIKCNETSASTDLSITVILSDFEFRFLNYTRVDVDTLAVNYFLKDYTGKAQEVQISYKLVDIKEITISEGETSVSLAADESKELLLDIGLPKDAFGEFVLIFTSSNGREDAEIRENVFLPRTAITGFFISDENRRTLTFFGIIVLFFIAAFVALKVVRKRYKKYEHYHPPKHNRKLIHINVRGRVP